MRTCLLCLLLLPATLFAHDSGPFEGHRSGRIDCERARADEFGCRRVDLLSHWSIDDLDAGHAANDIWGWTDTLTGREYVLIGTFEGTVFFDIGNPEDPVRLGMLPGHDTLRCAARTQRHDDGCGEQGSAWRDIKVHADHAYIVSEAFGHGLQVFDLRQLRDTGKRSGVFGETAWFGGFGDAHNIAINESTGFAYVVGSNRYAGGPYFIDIREPARPLDAGGYAGDGYTHDAQCVIYRGPDRDYDSAEICFLSNEDTVSVLDVSDKRAPTLIARRAYARASYTHQGWLDETQRWFYVNDEQDETRFGARTSTYIWDMSDLDAPRLQATYEGTTKSIDHNNYVRGRYLYQSNYTAGLRILDISNPDRPLEVAWFDSFPIDDHASYNGTWSNYPYFSSGVIALSDKENGLFLLRHRAGEATRAADLRLVLGELAQPDTGRLEVRYRATVHNDGEAALDDVVITHLLMSPTSTIDTHGIDCGRRGLALDCAIGTLAAGTSSSMTLTQTAVGPGNARAEVQATAAGPDPDTRNNKQSQAIALQDIDAATSSGATTPAPRGGGGGVFLWGTLVVLLARKVGHGRRRLGQ